MKECLGLVGEISLNIMENGTQSIPVLSIGARVFWFLVYQRQQKKKITVDSSWVDRTIMGSHHYRALLKKGAHAIERGRKGVDTRRHVALFPEKIQGACLSASSQVDLNELTSLWRQSN
jgi:hypothetical protein